MRPKKWLPIGLVVAVLTACVAEDAPESAERGGSGSSSPSPSGSTSPSPSASVSEPTATPSTQRQRVLAVIRDRTPDADEVIALAKAPTAWTTGTNTVLVEYGVTYPFDWPLGAVVIAARVLDRRGRVLGQWIEPNPEDVREYWPVGRQFVGIARFRGYRPVLIREGALTPLTKVRGARPAGPGDLRFGRGWLLDRTAGTVTREWLPGCRSRSIRTDPEGRVWCLDSRKEEVSWSDDGGRTWSRHRLSDSYFEYCDGGTLGADLAFQGDVVAIGLWRADFSLDRGRTWYDVDLPLRLVGSRPATIGSEANCTNTGVLPDGRLVISYFGDAVAENAGNTSFTRIRTPRGTQFVGVDEGVMLAASRRAYGDLFASYDGGNSWRPLRVRALVRHLLTRTAVDR